MTREEAAQALARMLGDLEDTLAYEQHSAKGYQNLYESREALQMGAEALMPWVRTADRVPTGKDTNERGQVLARHLDGVFWVETYVYISTYPDLCPYWMPIPPLPEEEE
jgi:hypothetical protein